MCNILSEIDRFGARCPPNFQVKSPLSIVSCRIVDIHSKDDIANILPWFPPHPFFWQVGLAVESRI